MENAIIMASGLGTRMRPLTLTTPKPLIKVRETPMIETLITTLRKRGAENIYVVVGYLADQFDYLKKKYGVTIIYNEDYETANNISSLYYARDVLTQGDCFICEADLYIADTDLLNLPLSYSGYFGEMKAGYSDDWVFELDDSGYISRVGKGGIDCYNMVGISFFKQKNGKLLSELIGSAYYDLNNRSLFWDDIVNRNLNNLKLQIYPIRHQQIIEIDTVEELNAINHAVR